MKYNNLESVLRDYTNDLQIYLKKNVPIASGKLHNSIDVQVNKFGSIYKVSCRLDEVYKYIEEGRKPGSFPNLDAIVKWIKVKPIIPRPYKGKLPTTNQLAFLIGRSIKKNGIKPKPFINNTVESVHNKYEQLIYSAIEKDAETFIVNKLKSITK